LNNFVRGGWKTKPYETTGAKSRSENEGLDSMANGLTEIEAGDVKDGKKQTLLLMLLIMRFALHLTYTSASEMSGSNAKKQKQWQ
jgi:hypothetical protein